MSVKFMQLNMFFAEGAGVFQALLINAKFGGA